MKKGRAQARLYFIARPPAATKCFTAKTAEFTEKAEEKLGGLRALCG